MGLFGKNNLPVEGRTVLLTGASQGLGRAVARQFAAKGANVIIVARNATTLESVVGEMRAAAKAPHAQKFHLITADVTQPNYAAAVVAAAKKFNDGRAPDIVWTIAGISIPMLWAEDDGLQATRSQMDVNFWGAAEMAHAVLREWLSPENKAGAAAEPKHFVFTASVLAMFPITGYGTYNSSKFAVRGLADTLAQEMLMYPENPVKIHIAYPANIKSPGYEMEQKTKPDITQLLEKDDPQQTPDEVATAAIAGLEKGHYAIPTTTLGHVFRWGSMGNSMRNNWFVDTVMSWFVWIFFLAAHIVLSGQIRKFAKEHGHPSTYPSKKEWDYLKR